MEENDDPVDVASVSGSSVTVTVPPADRTRALAAVTFPCEGSGRGGASARSGHGASAGGGDNGDDGEDIMVEVLGSQVYVDGVADDSENEEPGRQNGQPRHHDEAGEGDRRDSRSKEAQAECFSGEVQIPDIGSGVESSHENDLRPKEAQTEGFSGEVQNPEIGSGVGSREHDPRLKEAQAEGFSGVVHKPENGSGVVSKEHDLNLKEILADRYSGEEQNSEIGSGVGSSEHAQALVTVASLSTGSGSDGSKVDCDSRPKEVDGFGGEVQNPGSESAVGSSEHAEASVLDKFLGKDGRADVADECSLVDGMPFGDQDQVSGKEEVAGTVEEEGEESVEPFSVGGVDAVGDLGLQKVGDADGSEHSSQSEKVIECSSEINETSEVLSQIPVKEPMVTTIEEGLSDDGTVSQVNKVADEMEVTVTEKEEGLHSKFEVTETNASEGTLHDSTEGQQLDVEMVDGSTEICSDEHMDPKSNSKPNEVTLGDLAETKNNVTLSSTVENSKSCDLNGSMSLMETVGDLKVDSVSEATEKHDQANDKDKTAPAGDVSLDTDAGSQGPTVVDQDLCLEKDEVMREGPVDGFKGGDVLAHVVSGMSAEQDELSGGDHVPVTHNVSVPSAGASNNDNLASSESNKKPNDDDNIEADPGSPAKQTKTAEMVDKDAGGSDAKQPAVDRCGGVAAMENKREPLVASLACAYSKNSQSQKVEASHGGIDDKFCCLVNDQELKVNTTSMSTEQVDTEHTDADPSPSVNEILVVEGEVNHKEVSKFQVEVSGIDNLSEDNDRNSDDIIRSRSKESVDVACANLLSSERLTKDEINVEPPIIGNNEPSDVKHTELKVETVDGKTDKVQCLGVNPDTDKVQCLGVSPDSSQETSDPIEVSGPSPLDGNSILAEKDSLVISEAMVVESSPAGDCTSSFEPEIGPNPDSLQDGTHILEGQVACNNFSLPDSVHMENAHAHVQNMEGFHEINEQLLEDKNELAETDENRDMGSSVPEAVYPHCSDNMSMNDSDKDHTCKSQDAVMSENIEGCEVQGMRGQDPLPECLSTSAQVELHVEQHAGLEEQFIDTEEFDFHGGQEAQAEKQSAGSDQPETIEDLTAGQRVEDEIDIIIDTEQFDSCEEQELQDELLDSSEQHNCNGELIVGQEAEVGEQITDFDKQEIEVEEQTTSSEQPKNIEEKLVKRGILKPGSTATPHWATYELPPDPEGEFAVSDLVLGKVRSHPWWPGQIFEASDSSEEAVKYYRKDCYLVAYFGDRTFAWNEASLLKSFRTHFMQIEKHSSEAFQNAVNDALGEVSRRVELGLACSCIPKEAYDKIKYQIVENTGIREESSRRDGVDTSTNVNSFDPAKFLAYINALAQFPTGGCNRLELVTAKAQLLALNRLKGYSGLPELQLCGHLQENEADTCHPENNMHYSEVIEFKPSAFHSGIDDEKLKCENVFSRKRKHIHPKKKEKTMSDIMGESLLLQESDDGLEVEGSSKLVSKKRRAVGSFHDDSTEQDRKKSIVLAKVSQTTATSLRQSFKVGECISRVASQMTRSPSILKCSSDKTVGGEFDVPVQISDEMGKLIAPEESSSPDEMLAQLDLAAQDPCNGYSFLNNHINFFRDYRNYIVFSRRENLPGAKTPGSRKRKASQSPETFEFEDMNDSYWTDRVIQNNTEAQPSRRGRKRKGEVQLVTTGSQNSFLYGNHDIAGVRPPQDLSPTELILNFAELSSVPSETYLNNMFKRFGPLRESETEIDRLTSRARVVFKRCSDAEVALSSAGTFNIFGATTVNYQLSYSPSISFKSSSLAMMEGQEDAICLYAEDFSNLEVSEMGVKSGGYVAEC